MVHRTPTGERIKQLISEVKHLDDEIANLSSRPGAESLESKLLLKELEKDRRNTLVEVEYLKTSGKSRLEDVSIFKVEKVTKKDKVLAYWYAAWRNEKRTHNAYLGSCKSMDSEAALRKAKRLKAEALGVVLLD